MINITLFTLSHLLLLAFIVHVARFRPVDYNKSFDSLVGVFIVLITAHCILLFLKIATPVALLYGPIHFGLYRLSVGKPPKKYMIPQLLPFFMLFGLYWALYYAEQMESSWSAALSIYYPLHFGLTIISSAVYATYIWLVKWKAPCTNPSQRMLILQLATIAFVIAAFLCISLLTFWGRLDHVMVGFNAIYIICGLLMLCVCFLASYLYFNQTESLDSRINSLVSDVKAKNAKYYTNNINENIFRDYAQVLEKAINDKKLHLDSGLSLDSLSIETHIPRHHLSQLFNIHFGKNFYQYIAERRIQEAVSRIQEDDNITLESLAYECGFNSKTSFNRYFKEITGATPSEFRSSRILIK